MSDVRADFDSKSEFLILNEDLDEDSLNEYIPTEFFDKDGNIINQEVYDKKVAELKTDGVYKNVSLLLQREKVRSKVQENVNEYADGLLNNKVWFNTETQKINDKETEYQQEKLDDRKKKLIIKGELLEGEYNKSVEKT